MRAVPPRNTAPELSVRRALHRMGLRFRLHVGDLPGTPDIVFRRSRVALFVHGCFWHRHPNCPKASTPSTRTEFWKAKFAANVARDRRSSDALIAEGWHVQILWECQIVNSEVFAEQVRDIVELVRSRRPRFNR